MKIYQKLSDIQAKLLVEKTGVNPHFKSEYFKLNDILQALRPLLAQNKICLYQKIMGDRLQTVIIDLEMPENQIESWMAIPSNLDAQKTGSAISYFKRYSLTSLFLIEERDDDGNDAANIGNENKEMDKKEIKNNAPISMSEAQAFYEKCKIYRGWAKADADHRLYDLFEIQSATRLTKHQFDKIMKDLEQK